MSSTTVLHASPVLLPPHQREGKRPAVPDPASPAVTVTVQVTLPASENIDSAASLADRLRGAASAATSGADISTTVALLVDRKEPLARRPVPLRAVEDKAASLRILTERRDAQLSGEPMTLTRREYDLLLFFATHAGRVFTRPQLLRWVWGHSIISGERTVDVHVRRLRSKLQDLGPTITTVRGIGYRLDDSDRVEVVPLRPATVNG
jgi:Transcriptional regulatory protein, C terminal